ncbi:MAG TPA: MaoC family dehydratase N-terminal domain-containing protein [Actinomycetales bacterium]|nr:MaoC family dehydratase N-terminal domain-containing protein [Actinomycetales bacterium]
MGVDASFAGREYPATDPYQVGREHVREFAAAVDAQHPFHHSVQAAQEAGYLDIVAPPTFAVVIAQRAEQQLIADPAAGIDFSRVVHADETFTHHRPIVAGDELSTILHVDSIVERAAIAMVTTRCEIADTAGNPVATVVSTLAIRGEDA